MSSIMQARALRQLQPISYVSHALKYLEWAIEFWPELATTFGVHLRHWPVKKTEAHPLPDLKLDLTVSVGSHIWPCVVVAPVLGAP